MTNRRLVPGVNDLATTMPDIAAQWNYDKNGSLSPRDIKAGSRKKVWWRCEFGHEYETTANHRKYGHGCPYCSGLKALSGVNDLATTMPEVAAEWNYEKNGDLTPRDVKAGSRKKVWWRCAAGHEWEMAVNWRKIGCGCPYCSHQRILRGFNDLATTMPEVAAEWNYEKNGALTPWDVVGGRQKVWWKCRAGHEYYMSLRNRKQGYGCPYCSNHKLLPGFNDLATKAPEVAANWNYEKNGDLTPQMVSSMSMRKVWWKCGLGHEYDMVVHSRSEGKGCPYCSGRKVLAGFNDLATTAPEIAASWNYEKNGDLTPQMVTAQSKRKVWWKCANNHEWIAKVDGQRPFGCPYCFGLRHSHRRLVP